MAPANQPSTNPDAADRKRASRSVAIAPPSHDQQTDDEQPEPNHSDHVTCATFRANHRKMDARSTTVTTRATSAGMSTFSINAPAPSAIGMPVLVEVVDPVYIHSRNPSRKNVAKRSIAAATDTT